MKTAPAHTIRPPHLLFFLSCALCLLVAPVLLVRLNEPAGPGDAPAGTQAPAMTRAARLTPEQAREAYGRIEMSFEANRGQTDESVNFLARGAGYSLFLKPAEAVLVLSRGRGGEAARGTAERMPAGAVESGSSSRRGGDAPGNAAAVRQKVLRMKLVGADARAGVAGADELAGKANYFVGDDPARWRANVPTYGRVRYSNIYPGIDVVYYGNQRQLEYDFVVAPGGDARAVKLQFDGADKVELDSAGDLLLTMGGGTIRQPKPVVYQEVAGARRAVEGGYALGDDGRVGFVLGGYDAALPLVIDPVIVYSTYLGGSGSDSARDIALDASGNAYMCGGTTSTNFPTANAFDPTFNTGNHPDDRDAFVTKLNAAGTGLVYSTYLGGTGTNVNLSGDDVCTGIAVDSAGNAYLAGETRSTDFPLANAFDTTFGGLFEGYLTKLNAAGNALVYSTYIGGDAFDSASSVAVDSSNNPYVAGRTTSSDFPTANAIQSTFAGGGSDAFVMKFNAAGTALVYSTYLGGGGGNGFDAAFGIAIDPAGNAYITGPTISTNFPTFNAIDSTFGGGTNGDGYVAKLNAAGNALVYSTYLGGSGNDLPQHIIADSAGNAYVTGGTESNDFPLANAFDSTLGGTSDAFVSKINPTGSAFVYSTYLGGTAGDGGNDIRVDSAGNAHVAGFTASTNFPTVDPTQAANAGGSNDAFAAKFNAAGSALLFSTYLGGGGLDSGFALGLDSSGNIYVAGITLSTNFPTAGPVQAANGGSEDAFVTKINPFAAATSTLQFAQPTYTVAEGLEPNTSPASLTVTVTRLGDTSTAASVEYRTVDLMDGVRCDTANGMAYNRCDYATTLGTLSFAANETSKTFSVFITDDSHVEGNEMFQIVLENAAGASIGAQAATTVTIQDNDTLPGAANPIDTPEFFVRQHYIDFLARAPEASGFAAWLGVLNNCGPGSGDRGRNPACDRVVVSSSFFRSDEFLDVKGYFAYRFYEVSFDRRPTYREFVRDLQRLTGTTAADTLARQAAYTTEFTQRPEFIAAYPVAMTPSAYVDALFNTAELGGSQSITRQDGVVLTRAQLADGSRTRAQILREIVESREVETIFFNRAFVAAQYFGYLRRDPEQPGYQNWLNYLNANPTDFRTMVNGFVNSIEYRLRFGQVN